MKNIATLLTFMMLCFQASAIEIVTQKQYPPYPDIWGADLTHYPWFRDNQAYLSNKVMPNGDHWFMFPQGPHKDYIPRMIHKFFANQTIEISRKDQFDIDSNEDKTWPNECELSECISKIKLKNGQTIEAIQERYKCLPIIHEISRLIKRNNKGDTIGSYTVLMVKEKAEEFLDDSDWCDSDFVTNQEPVKEQVLPINAPLLILSDGTFLVWSSNGLIIRLDENLKTKFKTGPVKLSDGRVLKSKFFVLNYSVVEKIILEVRMDRSKPTIQAAHDRIADYLYENQDQLIKEILK